MIKRFEDIEIGKRFYDLTSKLVFIKDTEHTAGSSSGAHLEFAQWHLVSVVTGETKNGAI